MVIPLRQTSAPLKASLFVTCIIDQFYPEVGESVARVLRRLGVDLDFPRGQTCCGQPAFNAGYWSDARPLAKRTLRTLRGERYIVVPSGSCASMLRVFYPELLESDPQQLELAREMIPRVYEFSEFIVDVLGIDNLSPYLDDSKAAQGLGVTYHESCHLRRELGVTTQPRTLIESIPGVELVEMEQSDVCCGFGGTFAVKYADISGAILQDKIDYVRATRAGTLVACDSSCLMHIGGGMEKQGVAVRPAHLAQLIDENLRN